MEVLDYHPLPRRHRIGYVPEDSHLHPHLTEPGLVSPLDKILRAQAQGLPIHFNAGEYLDQDYSELDGMDSFELCEIRQNLTLDIELRQKEFHAATKLLAEKQKEDAEASKKDEVDTESVTKAKAAPKASKEADSSHNPS